MRIYPCNTHKFMVCLAEQVDSGKVEIGEHDFKGFKSSGTSSKSSVRTIYDAKVYKENNKVIIELTGNGFLYNMVRIISGTLIEVGKGRFTPHQVKEILEAKDRTKAGPTAPAKGLMLYEYSFENNEFKIKL